LLIRLGTSRWSLADFDIGKPLGKGEHTCDSADPGHFGKVYLARLKQDNFLVVLKCVTKELLVNEGGEHQIKREIEVSHHRHH
jgi:serine/threonine protein kinase